MATTKIGVYRAWRGPVPVDSAGRQIPPSEWPRKRPFSWVVRWFGLDGNRYSKSFENRKEAELFAESKQSDVREGRADPPPRIALKQYYREHQTLMKGNLAPKTLHMQLATLGLLAKAVGWDRAMHRVSLRDIERFRAQRLKDGLSAASANREIRELKRLFNLAIVRGYVPQGQNPCASVPFIKVGRKQPAYVSPQQFEALATRAADPLWRALLVLLYTTGLRLREALNLTWADIDFAQSQVHVTRKIESGWVRAWTPKDHDLRSVPLPPQALSLLTRWQSLVPERCPYVFMEHGRWEYFRETVAAGQWKGQDLTNNMLRRFKTLCRRAGVGPFTLHDLRRSCITNWARHLPIHVVQQLAGHSEIKTTQAYYLSVRPEDIAKAQAVQQALVGSIGEAESVRTGGATDQKLTNSGQKRAFAKRKQFSGPPQPPAD